MKEWERQKYSGPRPIFLVIPTLSSICCCLSAPAAHFHGFLGPLRCTSTWQEKDPASLSLSLWCSFHLQGSGEPSWKGFLVKLLTGFKQPKLLPLPCPRWTDHPACQELGCLPNTPYTLEGDCSPSGPRALGTSLTCRDPVYCMCAIAPYKSCNHVTFGAFQMGMKVSLLFLFHRKSPAPGLKSCVALGKLLSLHLSSFI